MRKQIVFHEDDYKKMLEYCKMGREGSTSPYAQAFFRSIEQVLMTADRDCCECDGE